MAIRSMRIHAGWFGVLGVFVATFGVVGVVGLPAASAGPFSVRSLNGTYIVSTIEIRQDDPAGPVEYCDQHGKFTFDGGGNGTVDNTRRCSVAGTGVTTVDHDVETLTYAVSPDGTFTMAFSSGDGGIGQLADNGKISFGSTAIAPGLEDARVFIRHGVGARQ
jgi:hypothetical protein